MAIYGDRKFIRREKNIYQVGLLPGRVADDENEEKSKIKKISIETFS